MSDREPDGNQFFLLALWAVKFDPGDVTLTPQPDGTTQWEVRPGAVGDQIPPTSLWALGVVAPSADEAWQRGMAVLVERHPYEDGWVGHHVTVNPVRPEISSRMAELVVGAPRQSQEDDEWPDVIG